MGAVWDVERRDNPIRRYTTRDGRTNSRNPINPVWKATGREGGKEGGREGIKEREDTKTTISSRTEIQALSQQPL